MRVTAWPEVNLLLDRVEVDVVGQHLGTWKSLRVGSARGMRRRLGRIVTAWHYAVGRD